MRAIGGAQTYARSVGFHNFIVFATWETETRLSSSESIRETHMSVPVERDGRRRLRSERALVKAATETVSGFNVLHFLRAKTAFPSLDSLSYEKYTRLYHARVKTREPPRYSAVNKNPELMAYALQYAEFWNPYALDALSVEQVPGASILCVSFFFSRARLVLSRAVVVVVGDVQITRVTILSRFQADTRFFETPLHKAVRYGNVKCAVSLLDASPGVQSVRFVCARTLQDRESRGSTVSDLGNNRYRGTASATETVSLSSLDRPRTPDTSRHPLSQTQRKDSKSTQAGADFTKGNTRRRTPLHIAATLVQFRREFGECVVDESRGE